MKNKNEEIKNAMNTMNESEAAFGLSKWIGAIFYYLINLRKKRFEDIDTKTNEFRNVITGWFLQILVAGFIIYLIFKIS